MTDRDEVHVFDASGHCELPQAPRVEANCDVHGPYVAFALVDSSGRMRRTVGPCPACAAEMRAKRAEGTRAVGIPRPLEVRSLSQRAEEAQIPPRFREASFDNYHATSEQQKAAVEIILGVATVLPGGRRPSLILSGAAGTGKTHLACALINGVLAQGRTALYASVAQVMRYARAHPNAVTERETYARFLRPDLLVLDEVGLRKDTASSDFERTAIFELANLRYEHRRPMVVITNLVPSELQDWLGEPVISRLREGGGTIVRFTWDNYRLSMR